MKILIIGASGFLGKKLFKILGENNEVFGTYFSKREEGLLKLDRNSISEVRNIFSKINPDAVIDANGMARMDDCEVRLEDCWKSNVEGTKNIANICKELGKKFIFISTDAVFDGKSFEQYVEDSKRFPINYYGESKLFAEKFLESNLKDFLILRVSTLYGYNGSADRDNFFNFVFSNLTEGKEIKIVQDQNSCPTLIDDVALACKTLIEKNKTGIFHTVGSEFTSKYDFALKIAEIFGMDKKKIIKSKLSEMKFEAPRPENLNLSIEKIKSLGVRMRGVEEGLGEMKKQMS